jgi:hypothetical protein
MARSMALQAHSSGVERYLDTVEVSGSKPLAPNQFRTNDARLDIALLPGVRVSGLGCRIGCRLLDGARQVSEHERNDRSSRRFAL